MSKPLSRDTRVLQINTPGSIAIMQIICNNTDMQMQLVLRSLKKSIVLIIVVVAVIILIYSFLQRRQSLLNTVIEHDKISVVASFYPLAFFTEQIGGERVDVYTITPQGVEPHEYEPTTLDVIAMRKASLLVLNGGHLEPWEDKIHTILADSDTRILVTGEGLFTSVASANEESIIDPHVWLDPQLAIKQARRISDALSIAYPNDADYFDRRLHILVDRLNQLDTSFENSLKTCLRREIITAHAAFGYIASRYGLKQFSIQGVTPEEEPSAKAIADMITLAKQYGLTHIFFESLVSPKVAQTIAQEVGAKTISFNPLEGLSSEEQNKGEDYFSIQEENIANLTEALSCQ